MRSATLTRAEAATLQRLTPTPEEYQKFHHPLFEGGIRTDKSPNSMKPNELSASQNMKIIAGRYTVDTGYAQLGGRVHGPQVAYQVYYPDGTDDLLLVSVDTVYRLNRPLAQWQFVSLATQYQLAAASGPGYNAFTLVDVTGISVGSRVGIELDGGLHLNTSVNDILGNVIITMDSVPAGASAANGNTVVLAIDLRGTYDVQVCIEPFVNGWIIISNGIDPIFYFADLVLMPLPTGGNGLPIGTTCQWMVTFHEQLYLIHTTEAGTEMPYRMRSCAQADATVWLPTAEGGPGGLQAIYDLLDTDDFLVTAGILGPWLIIYRETTIMRASYLGVLNETIFLEYMIFGEGAASQSAVSQIGDAHLLVGNSSVYLYRGDYTLESIGDAIYIGYLGTLGVLQSSQRAQLFTQYIEDYDEVWVMYPSKVNPAGTLPNSSLVVELDNNGWFPRQYPNQFVSCSPWIPLADVTWATAPGLWQDHTEQWNSRVFTKNIPNMLLCSPDASAVFVYDYTTQNDAGIVIPFNAETKDWQDEGYKFRTDSIRCYGQGMANVAYALDGSDNQFDAPPTWVPLGTIDMGLRHSMKIITFQVVTEHIRFQFSGNDPKFMLQWVECWWLRESEW